MGENNLLPIKKPDFGRPVKAIIMPVYEWRVVEADMVAVDEDDCDWRFLSDNCELSYDWDVVYWKYK